MTLPRSALTPDMCRNVHWPRKQVSPTGRLVLAQVRMGAWDSRGGYAARRWMPDVEATWAAGHAATRTDEVFASQRGHAPDWRCPLQRLAAVYAPGRAYSLRCVLSRFQRLTSSGHSMPSRHLVSLRYWMPLRPVMSLSMCAFGRIN